MGTNNKANRAKCAILIISVFLLLSLANGARTTKRVLLNVCDLTECTRFGTALRKSIDNTVDPCNDFYQYTCGNWIANHPLGSTYNARSKYIEWKEKINERMLTIMKKPIQVYKDSQPYKMAKETYKMCTSQIGITGLSKLKELIGVVGGWPIINPANTPVPRWQTVSNKIDSYYIAGPFYKISLYSNVKTLRRQIQIEPSEVLDIGSTKFNDQLTNDGNILRELVKEIAKTYRLVIPDATRDEDITNIINFTREISQLHPAEEGGQEMIISKLQSKYDQHSTTSNPNTAMDWFTIIRNVYSMHTDIRQNEMVLVWGVQYFYDLAQLLNRTPSRTIVNFLIWRFIRPLLTSTAEFLRTAMHFPSSQDDRDLQCLSEPNLNHAMYFEYIKAHVPDRMRTDALKYINLVKTELINQIRDSTWIDSNTKSRIEDKLQNMKVLLVGPQYTDRELNMHYVTLRITQNYFESVVNIRKFQGKAEAKLLRTQLRGTATISEEWDAYDLLQVNALYDPNMNMFRFPAGALSDFYFHPDRPPAAIFGLLGYVVGHEMSHSLDPESRYYDKYGIDGDELVWETNTDTTYTQKIECLKNQYSNYIIPGTNIHVNGTITITENFADTGIVTAYKAYKRYVTSNPQMDKRLSNLAEYNTDKLFFLSHASLRCRNYSPSAMQQILTDKHAIGWARVRGSLSNMPEFATTFKCAVGSVMNPSARCTLW